MFPDMFSSLFDGYISICFFFWKSREFKPFVSSKDLCEEFREIVGDPIFDVYDAADHVFDGFEVIAKEDQVFVLGNQEEEDVSFGAAKYVQHEENVVPQVSLWRSCDMP